MIFWESTRFQIEQWEEKKKEEWSTNIDNIKKKTVEEATQKVVDAKEKKSFAVKIAAKVATEKTERERVAKVAKKVLDLSKCR